MDFVIESMQPHDWEFVRGIYLEGLATGDATFETEAPSWEQWDAGHSPNCRLVARIPDGVLGWARELRVGQLYLVHMGNGLDYRSLIAELPDWAAPAYDGLEIA